MHTQNAWSDEWNQWQASSRSLETMRQIAQEVSPIIDDSSQLEHYARQHHLTINEIVYYFNVYEYGGDDGLEAIRNPDIIPTDVTRQALKTIGKGIAKLRPAAPDRRGNSAGYLPNSATDEWR